MPATRIAADIRARRLSAVEVAQAHLARMDAVNPAINAVVQEFPTRRWTPRGRSMPRCPGRGSGAAVRRPVTIKVNVDQKGHATTNGLRVLANHVATEDSPVVSNLRKAGAVIVGRTNTPAFSLRWFTRNALHGQTLNPRNRDITPGGSSGGAAAAVAAGLCAIGHGTDIAGSIRYPAYACGLHGLRPSPGRVPAVQFQCARPLHRRPADGRFGAHRAQHRRSGDRVCRDGRARHAGSVVCPGGRGPARPAAAGRAGAGTGRHDGRRPT
jgi:amidase